MSRVSLVKGGKVIAGKSGGKSYGSGTFVSNDGKTTQKLGTPGVKNTAKGNVDAYQATYEPTVVTDATIREDVIPDINSRIDKLTETGQYYDQVGNKRNADGSIIEEQNTESDRLVDSANDDSDEQMRILTRMQQQTDADTARQLKAIQAQYKINRELTQDANAREEKATDTALLMGGSSRHTTSGGSISAAKTRAGILELAQLDALEQAAIAEVKAAQSSQNYKLASEKLSILEKRREEKLNKAAQIAEDIAAQNERARAEFAKRENTNAIASQIQAGFTNPIDIYSALGGDVPLDDILAITKELGFDKQGESFTLGPNDIRYDAKGNVIARGAKAGGGGGGTGIGGAPLLSLDDPDTFANVQSIMANLPTKIRDSDADREIVTKGVLQLLSQGKSRNEIIDVFNGFKIENPTPLSEGIRTMMATGNFPAEGYSEIARLLNTGKNDKAVVKVENALFKDVDTDLKKAENATSVMKQADRALELLTKVDPSYLGPFDGRTFGIKKGIFRKEDAEKIKDAQQFAAAVTGMIQEFRRTNVGTAATESEAKFLEPLIAGLNDQPEVNKIKIEEFRDNILLMHNSARQQVGLPTVDKTQLLDPEKRIQLYTVDNSSPDEWYRTTSSTDLINSINGKKTATDTIYQPDEEFWDNL